MGSRCHLLAWSVKEGPKGRRGQEERKRKKKRVGELLGPSAFGPMFAPEAALWKQVWRRPPGVTQNVSISLPLRNQGEGFRNP